MSLVPTGYEQRPLLRTPSGERSRLGDSVHGVGHRRVRGATATRSSSRLPEGSRSHGRAFRSCWRRNCDFGPGKLRAHCRRPRAIERFHLLGASRISNGPIRTAGADEPRARHHPAADPGRIRTQGRHENERFVGAPGHRRDRSATGRQHSSVSCAAVANTVRRSSSNGHSSAAPVSTSHLSRSRSETSDALSCAIWCRPTS